MIPKKGRRKLVVDGKVFYWSFDTGAIADENRKFIGYLDYEAVEQLPHNETYDHGRIMPVQAVEGIRRGLIKTVQQMDNERNQMLRTLWD